MTQTASTPRLTLVDPDNSPPEVAEAFTLLPALNVFRAMANATTLFPPYQAYLARTFKPLALDAALDSGDTNAGGFTDAQKAALAFSDEVMDLIEVTEPTYQAASSTSATGR
jgi:hypothetical protein